MNSHQLTELHDRLLTLVASHPSELSMVMVLFSVVAVWLAGSRHRAGWAVGLLGQGIWLVYGLGMEQIAFVIHALVIGGAYARNWWAWGPRGSVARRDRAILELAERLLLIDYERPVNLSRRSDVAYLRERLGEQVALPRRGEFHLVDIGPVNRPQLVLIPRGEAPIWACVIAAKHGHPTAQELAYRPGLVLGQPAPANAVAAAYPMLIAAGRPGTGQTT